VLNEHEEREALFGGSFFPEKAIVRTHTYMRREACAKQGRETRREMGGPPAELIAKDTPPVVVEVQRPYNGKL
jgi:hypothetical protein